MSANSAAPEAFGTTTTTAGATTQRPPVPSGAPGEPEENTSVPARGVAGAEEGAGRSRALTLAALVDAVALVVMLGASAVGLAPAWGDWSFVRPVVVGLVVGLVVAWCGAWRRWPAYLVLPVACGAWLAAGGLALPNTAVAGVLPSTRTVHDLLAEAVAGWKDVVTSVPPLSSFAELAVVPYLLFGVAGLVGGTLAWRARRRSWAAGVPPVCLVVVAALGTAEDAFPLPQAVLVSVVGLMWAGSATTSARLRSLPGAGAGGARRRLAWYRARTSAVLLVVGAGVGALVAPQLLPAGGRSVIRDEIVPPLNLHDYVSPLTSFRKYTKDMADDDLFTVEGLPEDARIRLATLDLYDGTVYDASSGASGVFHRAGTKILSTAAGTPAHLGVTVESYQGVWLPDVGAVTGIDWSGPRAQELAAGTYYNAGTGTAITTAGLATGDHYDLDVLVSAVPTEADLRKAVVTDAAVPALAADAAPANIAAKAEQFMGTTGDRTERLFLLRDGLEASGIYSSGIDPQPPSRPGHAAERIDALLGGDTMVGDDEQFAVALALMANHVGIPARVVMGFYPDEGTWTPGRPYQVTGSDVHAWVEVPFEGYGWAPITVRPDEDNRVEPQPRNDQVPKPPIISEPEPPEEPAREKPSTITSPTPEPGEDGGVDWSAVLAVVVCVLVPLLVLAGPIVAVLAYKARRRAKRRRARRAVDSFTGGWREIVDTARDLGTAVPVGTRREEAATIAGAFGEPLAGAVARRADATVFGVGEPSEQDVESFWAEVQAVIGALRASAPRHIRIRSSVSLRSVLRSSPSTIGNRQGKVGSSASERGPHE